MTKTINPVEIIEKYYDPKSKLYKILITHSIQVRDKALEIAQKHPELGADCQFIAEAAMFHDIGIFLTNAPDIECYGTHAYIEHGYLGADIIRKEGLEKHALVCERHTGLGLSLERIVKQKLPIPQREMVPISIEEKIICYADKFFSKKRPKKELKVKKIVKKLNSYTPPQGRLFLEWHERFR